MKRIYATEIERHIWGRFVDAYPNATGTGRKDYDPKALNLTSGGSTWITFPISKSEFNSYIKKGGLTDAELNRYLSEIDSFTGFRLNMYGAKGKAGMLSSPMWYGLIALDYQIPTKDGRSQWEKVMPTLGTATSVDISSLFSLLDEWMKGNIKLKYGLFPGLA